MPNNLNKTMLLLALSALLLGACSSPAAAIPNSTGSQIQEHSLRVTGVGQASGSPDVALLDLGVELRGQDLDSLVQQVNQTLESITNALEQAGINSEDIQTTRYNIRQEQQNLPEPTTEQSPLPANTIFVVSAVQRVRVGEIDQIGTIIQTGLDAGANTIYGLNFSLHDPSQLQAEARANALADAQERAAQIADTLGIELGQVIQVTEHSDGAVQSASNIQTEMAAGVPAIRQGQLSVSVSIDVVFAIEN